MEQHKSSPMETLKGLPVEVKPQIEEPQQQPTQLKNPLQEKHTKLIAQFSEFLQQEDNSLLQAQTAEHTPVTLFNLFTELAALKSEVKRESMQVKEAVGTFGGLLDTLKNSNQQLSTELEQRQQQQKQMAFGYQIPVFKEIFDLYDSVERTLESIESYKPSWWEKRSKKGVAFREQTIKGLEITLRRLQKILNNYAIEPIECVGTALNPRTMKVVKVVERKKQANGIVLAEIRKGYHRYGDTLRLAEVVVNKISNRKNNSKTST